MPNASDGLIDYKAQSASTIWFLSGLYLYLTADHAKFLQWSTLLFFVVGSGAAALIFKVPMRYLDFLVAKTLRRLLKSKEAVSQAAFVITLGTFVGWIVVIFLTARWVFKGL